ncbi:MAG: prepilin-type N-terminal cleavage/methylation domain-containing protein [Phycisphaerales bacterium]|nr:prepilin-type N-terminal cleavage/methylation domain-containing protein [Phycisphaerales bacterium]
MTSRSRRGFTLVEMLVVIAMIIVLLSLLLVGLNFATRTAQSANTRVLMQSMKQALVRFQEDVGYLPPVLDEERRLVEGPSPSLSGAQYRTEIQGWHSCTSLAEYLIGYGQNVQDGYGSTDLGEVPFTGIRSPGLDGVWGAGFGPIADRNPVITGRVYGPYFQLEDERLLGGLTPGGDIVFRDQDPDFDSYPKVIVDYWGRPIEYFRRNYPPGAITQSYRAVDYDGDGNLDAVPTLSGVIRLRPFELPVGAGTDVPAFLADDRDDRTTSVALQSAEFALFSPGPDGGFTSLYRYDVSIDPTGATPEELNRDNIVEVGP